MRTSAAGREKVPSQHEWTFDVELAIKEKSSGNLLTEALPLIYAQTPINGSTTQEMVNNKDKSERQSATPQGNGDSVPSVFPLPKESGPSYNFQSLQQWEGTTIRVSKGYVVARLRDFNNPQNPEKRATISMDDISDCDRSLIGPGAVFYWTLGYRIEPYGQKSLISVIRFRRLPSWTSREIKRAKALSTRYDIFFRNDA